MDILKLQYKLDRTEIEEALLCLNYWREGKFRNINLWIASISGVIVLAAYIREPGQFLLFVLLCIIILFLFYLMYGPEYSRKKRAGRIAQKGGEYKLIITDDGIWYGDQNERIVFKDTKDKKLFVSEHVYTLKLDQYTFTVPARILSEEKEEALVQTMKRHRASIIKIKIKENKGYGKREPREDD